MPRRKPKAEVTNSAFYNNVFRGYADNDKVSRKDNAPLRSYEAVQRSDDMFGVFKSNIVMVDVDSPGDAQKVKHILDSCNVPYLYQTTTRGLHFFFNHGKWTKQLKDRSHITSACGIEVDYKCYDIDGTKLSKTLPDGTVQPRPLLPSPSWSDTLVDLPPFLVPVHATDSFMELHECRNEVMYNYILKLLRYGLDKEECRHTLRVINKFVLPKGLPDNELDVILRDDAFPTPNEIFIYTTPGSKTPKLDFELFAKHLIEKHHIIKLEDRLYVYKDGVYVMLELEHLNEIIMSKLKGTTKSSRAEVLPYIYNFAPDREVSSYNYILFKNCIFDIVNQKMLDITPDFIFLNKIDHVYNPQTPVVDIVDTVFNNLSCNDKDVGKLLQEIIGYTFYRRNKMRKFFVLVGDGFNGKSTYLDMINNLLCYDNVARVDLQELVSDKFAPQMLTDKLVDIGDDIDKEFVANTGKFKKLVTGETITAQKKGQDQYQMKYYGKFIFSCNEIPRINDKTFGMKSRMVIVPLKADFSKQAKIPFVDELLEQQEAMEYILKLAMDALIELLNRGSFTLPDIVVTATEEYHYNNDSIAQWLDEFGEVDQKSIKECYMSYSLYCSEGNMKPEGKIGFCKRIYANNYTKRDVKNADRKSIRIFEKTV